MAMQDLRFGLQFKTAQLLLEPRDGARQFAQVVTDQLELLLDARARNADLTDVVEQLIEQIGIDPRQLRTVCNADTVASRRQQRTGRRRRRLGQVRRRHHRLKHRRLQHWQRLRLRNGHGHRNGQSHRHRTARWQGAASYWLTGRQQIAHTRELIDGRLHDAMSGVIPRHQPLLDLGDQGFHLMGQVAHSADAGHARPALERMQGPLERRQVGHCATVTGRQLRHGRLRGFQQFAGFVTEHRSDLTVVLHHGCGAALIDGQCGRLDAAAQ